MPALENVREASTDSINEETASLETTPVLVTVSSMSSAQGPNSPSSSCNGKDPSLYSRQRVNCLVVGKTHSTSACSVSTTDHNSGISDARSTVRDTVSSILTSRSLPSKPNQRLLESKTNETTHLLGHMTCHDRRYVCLVTGCAPMTSRFAARPARSSPDTDVVGSSRSIVDVQPRWTSFARYRTRRTLRGGKVSCTSACNGTLDL